jgi:hypothetical protein
MTKLYIIHVHNPFGSNKRRVLTVKTKGKARKLYKKYKKSDWTAKCVIIEVDTNKIKSKII